jgi:hypothetical protein
MSETSTSSDLDRLAAELAREVRHASGARANADLVAAFDGMTRDVEAAAVDIERSATVMRGPSPLLFADDFPDAFRPRTEWVQAQIAKVRDTLEKDPMRVRQGSLWGETRRAFTTLREELNVAVDTAYTNLLDSFTADDRRVLETLPPSIAEAHNYSVAIDDFDRFATARPATPDDVTQAAAAGRRLQTLRERVEAEAVPPEFHEQWRLVRTAGLPLTELTDPFVKWLRERGLANSTVLTYRAQ